MMNARLVANQLADLLRRERVAMADFLVALADFDRRQLWIELGHSSLFYFLHRELGLSKAAAYYRKVAAELVQKYPEVVEPLRDGRLCITSIIHLAKVLTPENRRDVLPRFFQRSKREAMFVAAELQPAAAAPHRDIVTSAASTPMSSAVTSSSAVTPATSTPVSSAMGSSSAVTPATSTPVSSAMATSSAARAVHPDEPERPPGAAHALTPAGHAGRVSPSEGLASVTPPSPKPPPPRESTQPLTAELARLHMTVSKRFLQKLEAARAALSHSDPGANAERILEVGLDLILKRHASRKGLLQKPRKNANKPRKPQKAQAPQQSRRRIPAENPGDIPAAVRRAVWLRDDGRCQWRLEAGGICASTLRVEFDHSIVRAFGGAATVENIRLLCRMHNDLAARRVFGDAWMNQFTRKKGSAAGGETTIAVPASSQATMGSPTVSQLAPVRSASQATIRSGVPPSQTTLGLPSG